MKRNNVVPGRSLCFAKLFLLLLAINFNRRDVGNLWPHYPFVFLAVLFQHKTFIKMKLLKRGRKTLLWERREFRAQKDGKFFKCREVLKELPGEEFQIWKVIKRQGSERCRQHQHRLPIFLFWKRIHNSITNPEKCKRREFVQSKLKYLPTDIRPWQTKLSKVGGKPSSGKDTILGHPRIDKSWRKWRYVSIAYHFLQVEGNKLALSTLYSLESTIFQRKAELAAEQNGKRSWTKWLLLDNKLLCSKIR